MTTVNFTARAAAPTDPVLDIETGTFEETVIATLDLTGTNMTTLNKLFEDLNTTLSSVKLPATLTTISDGAFASLAALPDTGIDWSACAADITIGGGAGVFTGSPLIKNLVLPAKVKVISDDALDGSNIQSLTIKAYDGETTGNWPTIVKSGATKLKTLIVDGAFKGVIGDASDTKSAFTTLETVTFNGNLGDGTKAALTKKAFTGATLTTVTFKGEVKAAAIGAGAFTEATKLANVSFEKKIYAAGVGSGSFGNATKKAGSDNTAATTGPDTGIKLFITYNPAVADEVATAFAQDAFNTSLVGNWAKLSTTTSYATTSANKINPQPYDLYISAAPYVKETPLKVATKEGSKYYYAKLWHGANDYKIAKKQGDATIIVYTAYVDASDATIYMENGHILDGYYEIPANTPVIVKSTSSADVKVNTGSGTNSFFAPNGINVIGGANVTGLSIKDGVAPLIPYFLAPFADYGFVWSKFKDERVLVGTAAGAYDEEEGVTTADFYVNCPVISAGGRLNVVWLDGSEEATAIQTVKKANAEKGAIYNLAGQKVNAAYKGVVIKDGKKYIQK